MAIRLSLSLSPPEPGCTGRPVIGGPKARLSTTSPEEASGSDDMARSESRCGYVGPAEITGRFRSGPPFFFVKEKTNDNA